MLIVIPQPESPTTTFRKAKQDHVFHCRRCQKCWMGNMLWKTGEGKYVCRECNQPIEDVTDAPLGKSFLQIVRPQSKAI
jgi:predicted SprT family Zn-dependent metalloprotease